MHVLKKRGIGISGTPVGFLAFWVALGGVSVGGGIGRGGYRLGEQQKHRSFYARFQDAANMRMMQEE